MVGLDLVHSESPVVTGSREQAMTANQTIGLEAVHGFLSNPFDGDLHAERVLSLANATLGVIRTASLAVNTIGQGLAFGARPDDQARDQASGPAVVQRRLMLRCATGFPMCRAPASTWRWTGPLWRTLGHCGLRDTKDLRFGMGMESIHVSTPAGRDRLWLLNALAIALLTLLGAPGEALGYDRHLKSNTGKRRTQ